MQIPLSTELPAIGSWCNPGPDCNTGLSNMSKCSTTNCVMQKLKSSSCALCIDFNNQVKNNHFVIEYCSYAWALAQIPLSWELLVVVQYQIPVLVPLIPGPYCKVGQIPQNVAPPTVSYKSWKLSSRTTYIDFNNQGKNKLYGKLILTWQSTMHKQGSAMCWLRFGFH
jgi:hypothetical protein